MRNIGFGGAVALQEQCLYQIPVPCYPREEADESPCKSKRRGCKADAARIVQQAEAKIFQKMYARVDWGHQPQVAGASNR
jgi:hypothetical protein